MSLTDSKVMGRTDLRGQVAIVTGAGQGIGRASALHLAQCGARVLVNSRLAPGQAAHEGRAAQVVAQILAAGGQAQANTLDVAQDDAGEQMVQQALAAWGRLDMVHANAALGQHSLFAQTGREELHRIMRVGFGATMDLFHAAWPHMKAQGGGRLLATTSSAGRFGGAGLSAYGASKGAIEALVRTLAQEGRRHGIVCNAISPYAQTQMTEAHLKPHWAQALPAQAIAPLVAWLLAPDCPVSGEVLVSGGLHHARAWSVETPARAGEPGLALWSELQGLSGRPQADAQQAFMAFMEGFQ